MEALAEALGVRACVAQQGTAGRTLLPASSASHMLGPAQLHLSAAIVSPHALSSPRGLLLHGIVEQ